LGTSFALDVTHIRSYNISIKKLVVFQAFYPNYDEQVRHHKYFD